MQSTTKVLKKETLFGKKLVQYIFPCTGKSKLEPLARSGGVRPLKGTHPSAGVQWDQMTSAWQGRLASDRIGFNT